MRTKGRSVTWAKNNSSKVRTRAQSVAAPQRKRGRRAKVETMGVQNFHLLQLVWAKFSRYPPWPAIISNDDELAHFFDGGHLHVQFFDVPITTAWVPIEDVTEMTKDNLHYPELPTWVTKYERESLLFAIKEATAALDMTPAQRQELVTPSEDSDSEDLPWSTRERLGSSSPEPRAKKKKKSISAGSANGLSSEGHADEMCAYEKIRLQNMERHAQMLSSLKFSEFKTRMTPTTKNSRKTGYTPYGRGLASAGSEKPELTLLPKRKSLRLQRIDPNTGVSLPEKEPTKNDALLPKRKSLRLQRIHPSTGVSLPEKEPTNNNVSAEENPLFSGMAQLHCVEKLLHL